MTANEKERAESLAGTLISTQMAVIAILEAIAKRQPETARIALKTLEKRSRAYSGEGKTRVQQSAASLALVVQKILDAKPQ